MAAPSLPPVVEAGPVVLQKELRDSLLIFGVDFLLPLQLVHHDLEDGVDVETSFG